MNFQFRTYNKPALSYNEQVDLLISRGLIVEDKVKATKLLEGISYYRLSAYMLPFKEVVDGEVKDQFKANTSLNDVYDLYVFDQELRGLVFSAISEIEVSLRTQLIYQLSHKYGPFWLYDKSIFAQHSSKRKGRKIDDDVYTKIQDHINDLRGRYSTEIFIRHYYQTYDNPPHPPAWMCVETMYFRQLLLICKGLSDPQDASGIAQYYHLKNKVFSSWILSLNYVRNICAHHARLWNRTLSVSPQLLRNTNEDNWISHIPQTDTVYYCLCTINYLLKSIPTHVQFSKELKKLFAKYPNIPIKNMGFVDGWWNESLWK